MHYIGQVDAHRISISSPTAGLVVRMPHHTKLQWSQFDAIQAGDVIAEFDDSQWRAQVAQLEKRIEEVTSALSQWKSAATKEVGEDNADVLAQLTDIQQQELSLLDAGLATVLSSVGTTSESSALDPPAIQAAPGVLGDSLRAELNQIRSERSSVLTKSFELQQLRESLEIRAPISGTLIDIFCAPGQRLPAGGPVATIAADHGRFIVSWLPEATPFDPQPGEFVTVRGRQPGSESMESFIEEVGGQLVSIPTRQGNGSAISPWGLPVRIAMPTEARFQPGSLVDVVFHRSAD